jgi:hypothetical protein
MDNPMVWQVGIGVLTLVYFFLVYMFVKTWRWFHVTITFFVYGASIAFLVYASITLKTHNAWRKMVVAQEKQVAQLKEERAKYLNGDLRRIVQEEPTLRDLQSGLNLVNVDVGRIWRGCQPGPAGPDGTVTVSTVPPGVAEAEAAPNHIEAQTVLYAFTDAGVPPQLAIPGLNSAAEQIFPRYYIGEFTATAATNTTVTLRPTLPVTNYERAIMGIPGVTWTLYETMPVDGHQLLATDPFADPDLTKNADEVPVFGNMDTAFLTQLFARAGKRSDETDEQFLQRFAKTLDQYGRDGKRAAADDPPDATWLKVRFTQPHEVDVDIPTETSLGAMSSEDFFDRGLAEIAVLRRNEPAKFKKNDVGVFSTEFANDLIGQGVCELIEPIYVRPLHRYDYKFREITQQLQRLSFETLLGQRDAEVAKATIGRTDAAIAYREQDRDKLKADLEKFQYERDQILAYRNKLKAHLDQQLAELSRLYRENFELEQELERLDRIATEQIEKRSNPSLATNP